MREPTYMRARVRSDMGTGSGQASAPHRVKAEVNETFSVLWHAFKGEGFNETFRWHKQTRQSGRARQVWTTGFVFTVHGVTNRSHEEKLAETASKDSQSQSQESQTVNAWNIHDRI